MSHEIAEPKPVAAVITEWRPRSHAEVILSRLLEPRAWGHSKPFALKLAAVYADQFPANDLCRRLCREHDVPVFPTITGAVGVGTRGVPVEGVLIVGEHGRYAENARGQRLYPRRRLFEGVVHAFRVLGRRVPVFNDKHLSYDWPSSRWMYDLARHEGFAFMAGSSLPLAWRAPPLALPIGSDLTEAFALGYGPLDAYGFHALETLQCMAERRRGGETGVSAVRCETGKAAWGGLPAGLRWRDHLDALTKVRRDVYPDARPIVPGDKDALFVVRYRDGLEAAVGMVRSAGETFAFSGRIRGRDAADATLFELEDRQPFGHFGYLLRAIERMVQTGRPSYPVERTLLTSGILSAALQSRSEGGTEIATPHLAEIRYEPAEWAFARADRDTGLIARYDGRSGWIIHEDGGVSMNARILPMAWALLAVASGSGRAADPPGDIRELKLRDWEPRSMMVTKATAVDRPKFPVVDVHNHLGGGKERLTSAVVGRYLEELDQAGVRTVVNLDGGWGDRLAETLDALDRAHPGRFLTFALVNFEGIDDEGWGSREADRLEASFRAGAKGLKFHKSFGLTHRYKDGRLVPVDDPKLDAIWEVCAKHKRPVVIHTADPAAFFTPLDRFNERWHELNQHPDWLFFGEKFPKRQDLLDQLHRVIARHPGTTFINTHFGNNAEDLSAVAEALDRYPNMYVDIDARISELGRQPYTARKFFLKYQDRILFGTDTTPKRDAYRIYYRFLETDDEYFDPSASHHPQGFWRIYGIYLPDEVLDKVYRRNAERILFGLEAGGPKASPPKELRVRATDDFELTGDGSAAAWEKADWEPLSPRAETGAPYRTRVKVLHSKKGLYVLMDATDKKITSTMQEDFLDLWTEDVFEVFLWPDERDPLYFEYEISPLNRELPILVPNSDGKFFGWRPWHYEGDRKTRKATSAVGGPLKSGGDVAGWRAEVFIPHELLTPLRNVPPKPGTRWRANFYRMDYDEGKTSSWDWTRVGPSFHEFRKFGTLVFE